MGEWGVDDFGDSLAFYVNDAGKVCEIYVYEDVIYVDAEGNLVEEGTEGATSVQVVAIEFYSYVED